MEWLVSYSQEGPFWASYRNWLHGAGIAARLVSEGSPFPRDLTGFDGLLLAGGADVEPSRYGDATVHQATYGVSRERDDLEFRLVEAFAALSRPVFGICRGLQVLSIIRGGALMQHVPDCLRNESAERHSVKDTFDAFHPVTMDLSTRLGWALRTVTETNSAHHQAVRPDRIGQGLSVVARSSAGILEALESEDAAARIAAVQWHPERLPANHPASALLLDYVLHRL